MDSDILELQRVFDGLVPRFGSNHATVYRCLLCIEAKSARQIIEETRLYRPVVYRILNDLVSFGLVTQLPGAPTMFYAEKPAQKLGSLCGQFKKKIDSKLGNFKKIIDNSTSLSGEEYLIRINGGQSLLINRKTRQASLDEHKLRELKQVIEEQLTAHEQTKIKAWAVYR
ncbi:MAG TPA: helix-turn-helix domain-containing protein [archaeon]|nr:helix-turn-helix domain-containing protein [archaeon]